MMKNHKVAILLATYNGSKYIQEFLDSLLFQTYTDFTLFVRDDASNDCTLDIIKRYSSKIDIKLIEVDQRLGPAASFLKLLVLAGDDFDFYFYADQDDYWIDSKVQRAVDHLSNYELEIALYCSRLEYVDQYLSHIRYSRIPKIFSLNNALVENIATGCTIAINRRARNLIVNNLPRKTSMHDWWSYIVVAAFGQIVYDEFPSIKYRQHSNNTVGVATTLVSDYKRRLVRFLKNDGGIFGLAEQTIEFRRSFSSSLLIDQLKLVNEIIDAKSSFLKRAHLFIYSDFIRQRFVDTLILRVLFLLGRF